MEFWERLRQLHEQSLSLVLASAQSYYVVLIKTKSKISFGFLQTGAHLTRPRPRHCHTTVLFGCGRPRQNVNGRPVQGVSDACTTLAQVQHVQIQCCPLPCTDPCSRSNLAKSSARSCASEVGFAGCWIADCRLFSILCPGPS